MPAPKDPIKKLEWKKKIGIAHIGKMLGDSNPSRRPDVKLKIGLAGLGRKFSKATREKMSKSQIRTQANRLGNASKGDDVGYRALHDWIQAKLGRANKCEKCGLKENPKGKKRYFQWANVDHKYKRTLDSWIQLCCKCHKQFDVTRLNAKL
jgi:hypothetical protein